MSHITTVTVNGFDMSTLGLILSRPDGWRDSTERVHRFVRGAKRVKAIRVTAVPEYGPRELRLTGAFEGATNAEVRSREREIIARLSAGKLTVSFSDASTEIFEAFLGADGVEVRPIGAAFQSRRRSFAAHLYMPSPLVYENSTTTVSVSSTAGDVALPQGDGPQEVQVSVPSTAFLLTGKTSTGGTVGTFGLTSPAGSAPYTIDMRSSVMTVLSSSGASVVAAITTGTDFFRFESTHFEWWSTSWPTFALSGTPAASTATVTYRKTFLV